jgi:hypothetical protein
MLVGENVGFEDLDQGPVLEYWIMSGDEVLVKSACRPFAVGGGLRVVMPGRGESERTFAQPRAKAPKQPGFVSGLGDLGIFEVLAPTGATVASFRCRPFWTEETLAVKAVTGAQETLVTRGAAEFPEGTVRPRTRQLRTFRR